MYVVSNNGNIYTVSIYTISTILLNPYSSWFRK